MSKRKVYIDGELSLRRDDSSMSSDIKRFKQMENKKRLREDQDEQDDEEGHVAKYHNDLQDDLSEEASTDGVSSSSNSNAGSSSSASDTITNSDDEYEAEYESEDEAETEVDDGNGQMIMSSPQQPSLNHFLQYRDHHNIRTPDSLAVSATPGTAGTTDSLEGIRFADQIEFLPIRIGGLNLGNQGIAADEGNYESFYGLTTVGVAIALGGLMADFCG